MATDGKVTYWDATSGSPTYNAQEMRQLDSVGHTPGPASAPFSGRSGRRVNNAGLAVTVDPTGAGSVSVSPGGGVIYDGAYATQGAWRFVLPSAKTVALTARPGSGTSRIDLVVARIYDSALAGAGSVKELKIEVIAGGGAFGGTIGATPTPPSLPPLSIELARLTVTSTSGAAISKSDTTAVTVAAGGILPVATTAEMEALKTAGIAYRGMVVDNAQTGVLHRYDGAQWKLVVPVPVQSGVASAAHAVAGVISVPINFTTAFPGPPQAVLATMQAGNPTVFTEPPTVSNITANGCSIYVSRNSAGTSPVMWMASYT
jgi:hypothetical protein